MSLLGKQVYANPTTPIWGQGGGGGGSNFQTLNILENGALNFITTSPHGYTLAMWPNPNPDTPENRRLTVFDASANYATFQTGDLNVFGQGANPGSEPPYLSLGLAGTGGYGLRLLSSDTGSNFGTFFDITPNTTDFNLSNVKTINGVPYAATLTSFDFSNQAAAPVAETPNYTVLNSSSFTAPANGKLYMESLGNFVSTALGGGGNLGFSVNGTIISNAINQFNAYNSNVNLFGMSMYQIPVVGGLTYDISSIAQCSALPPAGSDLLVQTSRLFTLFTPN